MTNRCDHYTDRALTLNEFEAAARAEKFETFLVRCIDAEGAPPPLRAGGCYPVIGEVTEHIDGRPLDKCDERWILSVGEAAPQEFRKDRFIPDAEFLSWRFAHLRRRIDELRAELNALEEPDARF